MIGAFLAAAFQNNAFQVGGEPAPVTWGQTGGLEKRKHPVRKNQGPDIEKAINEAINKVTGVADVIADSPAKEYEPLVIKPSPYTFDDDLLQRQAKLLNQTIEEYRAALIQAELDDEEAILLLL